MNKAIFKNYLKHNEQLLCYRKLKTYRQQKMSEELDKHK